MVVFRVSAWTFEGTFILNLGAPETRCDNGANDGVTIGDLVDEDNDSWQAPAADRSASSVAYKLHVHGRTPG